MTITPYSYAERLAAQQAPRAASLLLGLRWSFGLPAADLTSLTEYSLPLNPTPILDALSARGGARIVRHEGNDADDPASLHDHLATGQPAIVAVDAFFFPFRPAYRRVHSSRTVLVTGMTGDGRFHLRDLWAPPAEGTVSAEEMADARFSAVPLDVDREPLFSGNPVGGVWFTVEAEAPRVEDAAAWARERLGWLWEEMATPRADERGSYGIDALREFRRRLEEGLDGEDSVPLRRGASLLLRPELTSRLYLGVFLRNAAHLLRDEALKTEVERYREALGHLQSAADALTKTVRTRRPEYDAFIRDHFARACGNEERLLDALRAYSP
jgi:hypothetical protein